MTAKTFATVIKDSKKSWKLFEKSCKTFERTGSKRVKAEIKQLKNIQPKTKSAYKKSRKHCRKRQQE